MYAYCLSAFEQSGIALDFFQNNFKQSIRTMAGFFKIITRSALAYYMYVLNTTILNKNACD